MGERVRVRFGRAIYTGVVIAVSDAPVGVDASKVKSTESAGSGLEPILPSELEFWRFIADYYLCSPGEVYKYVYPAARAEVELKKSRRLKAPLDKAAGAVVTFDAWKPLLLPETGSAVELRHRTEEVLASGRDVLVLSPGAAKESYAEVRDRAALARSSEPSVIEGGRFDVFLPFTKLGLVIIHNEEDTRYKQASISPRYNARDAALQLARIHGAAVILTSDSPSLETFLNVRTGKYSGAVSKTSGFCSPDKEKGRPVNKKGSICTPHRTTIIDTSAELRKNGMIGSFSRKLHSMMSDAFSQKGRVLLLLPWKDTDDIEIEARRHFPEARTKLVVKPLGSKIDYGKFALVALLRAEYLTGKSDFRADERFIRLLGSLSRECANLVIQTASSEHPAFTRSLEDLLEERRTLGLPPFTRLVELRRPGEAQPLRQWFLRKDSHLQSEKKKIAASVPPGCYLDVDPV